ncbi:MAG: CDP-alcohol phosphatidyltransferase family protein [Candidatus Aphodosoma sp.]
MKKQVPNIITLCNQLSGIIALIFAYNGNFSNALLFLLLGAAFDFCDGATARLLKVSSNIGKELDSLADMITFGLVPGMVIYRVLYIQCDGNSDLFYQIMPYLGFIITLASAYRLAKFNIDERQTSSFIGLATPANAIFWLGLSVSYNNLLLQIPHWAILILVIIFSFLLISEIPMFSLKFHNFKWEENIIRYIFLIGIIVLGVIFQINALPIIILWYILLAIIDNIISRKKINAIK